MHPFILKIIDVITSAGFVQGIFLAVILNSRRNKNNKRNRILSILILILSFSIAHSVFVFNYVGEVMGNPLQIKEPFILLIGPFLLLYIKQLTGKLEKIKSSDLMHLIPFLMFFVILLPVFIHGRTNSYSEFLFVNSSTVSFVILILIIIQYGIYYYIINRMIIKHRENVESEFSNVENVSLAWLNTFLSAFMIILILLLISIPVLMHGGSYFMIDRIIAVTLSFSVFFLGYKGLFQSDVFITEVNKPDLKETEVKQDLKNELTEKGIPEKSTANENVELVKKLLAYMEEKKPYLNEELTLTGFAKDLDITRNRLSQLINSDLNDNFYNFINKYRVEEVKKIISDPQNKDFTILSLAYEAGFPSKSSFNSIFKKFTGLTPTEYRNRLQK